MSPALAAAGDSYDGAVRPFLAAHCVLCHNSKLKTAGLDLQSAAPDDAAVWAKVLDKVRGGQMPPKGLARPKPEAVRAVTGWIDALLARQKPDPGRLTAHRLNRFEYNNTIHDLLDIDFRPADDFPADDSGYGFDNIGDVLSLSPVLMEKYLAAAEQIARRVVPADAPLKPTLERYKAQRLDQVGPELRIHHVFPVTADYELRAAIAGRRPRTAPQTLEVSFLIDGHERKLFHSQFGIDQARLLEFRTRIPAGDHAIAIAVLRDEPKPERIEPKLNRILVDSLEITGPYHQEEPPLAEGYFRVFVCGHRRGRHKPECAGQIVANLARRAWRRPVTEAEVNRLLRFVDLAREQGDSFEQGIRVALQAILVSPNFLYRIERDPNPSDPAAVHPIGPFELAARLSYFLWSSLPDEQLFHAAADGSLARRDALEAEVRRMLLDARSQRLVDNFAGQWLELRNLDSVKPDPARFPGFDDELRRDMRTETRLFFDSIVHEDRSILDFIDAPYTFLNDRLAKFYGIAGIEGKQFRRVSLEGNHERGGVLTQASVLTVTSYPNRTSPVLRGKFLLENVLDAPPPPPPPDAGALDESQVNRNGTVREQFEQHRANPACASCHVRMDPLGFAFENYDAIGRWRSHEGRFPVDASGILPDGRSFRGAWELKAILRTHKDEFARCLAEKMLTYALGRGLEPYDRPALDGICRRLAGNQYRFSSLVLGIVDSLPFQMGRGDAGRRPGQPTFKVARRGT